MGVGNADRLFSVPSIKRIFGYLPPLLTCHSYDPVSSETAHLRDATYQAPPVRCRTYRFPRGRVGRQCRCNRNSTTRPKAILSSMAATINQTPKFRFMDWMWISSVGGFRLGGGTSVALPAMEINRNQAPEPSRAGQPGAFHTQATPGVRVSWPDRACPMRERPAHPETLSSISQKIPVDIVIFSLSRMGCLPLEWKWLSDNMFRLVA